MSWRRTWSRALITVPAERTANGEPIELCVLVPSEELDAFHIDPIAWLLTHADHYGCARAAEQVGGAEALRGIVRAVARGAGQIEIYRHGGSA